MAPSTGRRDSRPAGLPPGLAQLFEIVLNTAAANRSLDEADLGIFRTAGADAALAGHRLASVIDAYLRGAGELWEQVLADPDRHSRGSVVELGRTLRRVSEDAVSALATGYEDAQRLSIRAEEAVRLAFLEDLLSGSTDADGLREAARRLRFPLAEAFIVATAGLDESSPAPDGVLERAERVVRVRIGSEGRMVAVHHGLLVVILPAGEVERLAPLASVLGSSEVGATGWRVGVGRPYPGPTGAATSFAEARRTLALARRVGWSEPVATWDDLVAYRLLAADPTTGHELCELVVRPLVEAPRGSLLPTVEAYLDCGGNMAEMARVLALSPRAVAYRLERIEAVTGRSLRHPDDRFLVELAVRCHRFLAGEQPVAP